MLQLTFKGESRTYDVHFAKINEHVVQIQGAPEKTKGFILSRPGKKDNWNYTAFTTVYKKDGNNIQYSDDGSIYIPPQKDIIIKAIFNDGDNTRGLRPDKIQCQLTIGKDKQDITLSKDNEYQETVRTDAEAEYTLTVEEIAEYSCHIEGANIIYDIIPSLEEVKTEKVEAMNKSQQDYIHAGVDVEISQGKRHFALSTNDQLSIMGLQAEVLQGAQKAPWHIDDISKACEYFSAEDMKTIADTAMKYITFHVSYFRDLRIYINKLSSKESVNAIYYLMPLPEKDLSQPLRDILKVIPDPFIYKEVR